MTPGRTGARRRVLTRWASWQRSLRAGEVFEVVVVGQRCRSRTCHQGPGQIPMESSTRQVNVDLLLLSDFDLLKSRLYPQGRSTRPSTRGTRGRTRFFGLVDTMPHPTARQPSPNPPIRPPRPPYASSLSSAATTHASALHFSDPPPFVVTRSDLRDSLSAYETLLSSAKAFRLAMMSLSSATAQFATALEGCARMKGAQGWSGYEGRKKQAKGKLGIVPGFDANGDEVSEDEAEGLSAAERLLAASGLHYLTANHEQVLVSAQSPLLRDARS